MKISKKQLVKLIKEQSYIPTMKINAIDDSFSNQKLFYNMSNIVRNIYKNNDLKSLTSYTLSQLIKKYPNDKYIVRLKKILFVAANNDELDQNPKDYLIN